MIMEYVLKTVTKKISVLLVKLKPMIKIKIS